MTSSCRLWWNNCALHADSEIFDIDRMEDEIGALDVNVKKIRELISSLELCHHKSERWIYNIIKAIGEGKTEKGIGTRSPGQTHPREHLWKNTCIALESWCTGDELKDTDFHIDTLGVHSSLKVWQVNRVIDKIQSFCRWNKDYIWMLLIPNGNKVSFTLQCPEKYKDHEDFWRTTVRTVIHDTLNGNETDLSLALAIDMLWPCHFRFIENLRIILNAIGGKTYTKEPFAACGRNIELLPNRDNMEKISSTLRFYCGKSKSVRNTNRKLLELLGKSTKIKRWLSASLDKTIRHQLHPPDDIKAISDLAGPDICSY